MRPLFKTLPVLVAIVAAGSGCELRQAMYDQEKFEPLERTEFFGDNRSSRDLIDGTVAQGQERANDHLYKGTINGEPAATYPFEITPEVLARGQERFNIYCSVCHGAAGPGDGLIVRRGYNKPVSYFDPRLMAAPPGYIFQIITGGKGVMASYADQVRVSDRWAIAAYVKTLQLSQHATAAELPEDDRKKLE